MINLLLLNHFYTDELKKKVTNCCIRFGHSLWSAINCQRKGLISCYARREFFCPKMFPQFSVYFKYNPSKTNDKFITSQ